MTLLTRAIVAGTIGGLAMIPYGLVLLLVLKLEVNVYGALLARLLFGGLTPWSLGLTHFATSWGLALPLVYLLAWRGYRPAWVVGAAYGALIWLAFNSLLLPILFDRSSAWQLGWSAIWPSLSVHLLYGVVTAVAFGRSAARARVNRAAKVTRERT